MFCGYTALESLLRHEYDAQPIHQAGLATASPLCHSLGLMSNPLDQIGEALKLFNADERGLHICSCFFDLPIHSHRDTHHLTTAMSGITHDLWNISTLVQRIEWTRQLSIAGNISPTTWCIYASLDIEQTLVQARSIMDHVAKLLQYTSPKKEQTPESFHKLRQSIARHSPRLPAGVGELIASANWFDSVRAIRDSLVHQGANPLVFGEPNDGVLFQVHGTGTVRYVDIDQCMYNQNVARFERYVALLFSNTLVFLDQLGMLLEPCFPKFQRVGPSRLYSHGFEPLRDWMLAFVRNENI